jgi:hypothetical protein
MTKEEFENLEKRFQETIYRNTMIMTYIKFNLGKIKLNNEEIQKLLDFFIEIEDYELCAKLQKHQIKMNNASVA